MRDVVRTFVAGQSQGLDQTFEPIDRLLVTEPQDASDLIWQRTQNSLAWRV